MPGADEIVILKRPFAQRSPHVIVGVVNRTELTVEIGQGDVLLSGTAFA